MATASLSLRLNRMVPPSRSPVPCFLSHSLPFSKVIFSKTEPYESLYSDRRFLINAKGMGSTDDSSASFEMSVESALKLLGLSNSASFEEIVRAKNAILAKCKDDQDSVSKVEAAYDMLLMESLSQRRAGKVEGTNIRYADVKASSRSGNKLMPQWFPSSLKNSPILVERPSAMEVGVQGGVYGALMAFTYINGTATASAAHGGGDIPGLILATSFGASLYFMTKRNVKLGKATIYTAGGLVAGAVVGSTVEGWLHVEVVPFLGLHSPASVITEFILFTQFLVSLFLR